MTMNDPLAAALSKIHNAEKIGKKNCSIKPASKALKNVFGMMNENHYLGEFKEVEDGK